MTRSEAPPTSSDPVSLATDDGTLIFASDGIRFGRYAMHGNPEMLSWTWGSVSYVSVDDQRARLDAKALALSGIFGLLLRKRRLLVIVSTADDDLQFRVKGDLPMVRAALRRLVRNAPAATGKIQVAGDVIAT